MRNLTFQSLDLSRMDGDEHFDVVVFSDIARSYSLDSDLVLSVASLVAPGGLLAMVVPSRNQRFDGALHPRGHDAGFFESEIVVLMQRAGLCNPRIRTVMGRIPSLLNIASRKVSSVSFELLVFLFPFIMVLSMLDLVRPSRGGDAFLVTATRPRT